MKQFCISSLAKFRTFPFFLILFWVTGFLLGLCFAILTLDSSFSLMHLAAGSQVSIVSLIGLLAIPILATDVIVRCRLLFFIYPVAFLKALTYSFCSICILLTFGESGWLIRALLFFSDSAMCIVLLFWWIKLLSGKAASKYFPAGVCAFAICIGVVDYFFVSPFLLDLMKLG